MAALLLLFLPVLLIISPPSAAQTNSTGTGIRLGSSLTASVSGGNSSNTATTSWTSPSGDFAFGFNPLVSGANNSTGFLLAIWFDNLPDKTIVWWGNGGNLVQAGSKLELSTSGQLVLYDHRENEVWRRPRAAASTSNDSAAVSATMLDTGNFVLRGSQRSGNNTYWSSFDEPTNTILPSQVLEFDGKLSTTRRSEDGHNYADLGRFELRMLGDGNLVLNTIALPSIRSNDAYYVSNTKDRGQRVVFNSSGDIYIDHREGGWTSLSNGGINRSTRDFFHRATLDSDGVFRHYVRPKRGANSAAWSPIWFIPSSICFTPVAETGSGICGFNSLCFQGEEDGRYECQCPTGYTELLSSADGSTHCKPRVSVQACELDSSRAGEFFDMETMANTNWPKFDYEQMTSLTEEGCKDNCLSDCLCNVAIFGVDGGCWKKKLPMSNGRRGPRQDGKALIKIWKGSSSNSTGPASRRPSTTNISGPLLVWGSLLLGSSSFVNLLFLAAAMVSYHFSFHKKLLRPNKDLIMGKNLRMFTYKDLVQITGGFKEELGRGAYGTVYKGLTVLSEHDHTPICVAVKQLEAAVQRSEKDVRTEVSAIGRTHHKNLVRLLGFCDKAPHRLLVYEYLKNGTLASYLFHGDPKPRWNDRLRIASGIASGLAYLHEECISKIMHCDVKPENVLLDDNFNPKISDFGLAKLMRVGQTRTSTGFRGTRGYVAPEWYRKMPVTVKVDVYSFGIMLLEVVCCRRNVEMERGRDERVILLDWAYRCLEERQMEKLVEEDEEAKQEVSKVERVVKVAMWCVQEEPSLRPAMHKVVQMLEGAVEVPSPPHPSSFLSALG